MFNLHQKNKKVLFSLYLFLILIFPLHAFAADGLLVNCATTKSGCVDKGINSLLEQAILIGKYLLGISGSLALLAFIYGGGVMLTSFGKADRFKKGRDILVAAVVGLLIAFGAYFIVDLVLQAIGAGGISGI